MKYLKGRERFLSDIKQLNQQQINEAFDMSGSQGPFGNDIAWGDSLVGRLINFVIRKIGVGVNMVRIQPVINRLKMEFRFLLENSKVAGLDEELRKKIAMFFIYQQIRIIKFAIVDMKSPGTDEDIEVGEVKDITEMEFSDIKKENYLIECESIVDGCVESMSAAVDEYGEVENFDELMKIMKELQGMIKIMKVEIKENEGEGEKGEEETEEEKSPIDDYITNFTSVCNLVLEYELMRKAKAEEFKASGPKSGENKGLTQSEPVQAQKEKEPVGSATMDSYSYISEAVSSPIFKPLKSLYDTMKQLSPEDLIQDMTNFVKMPPDNKKGTTISGPISKIYKYIRTKSGVKESLDTILSRDKVLGDAIIAVYNVSKTKPDGGFPEVTPKLKQALASFNQSMVNCLKTTTKPEAQKPEEKAKEEENKNLSDVSDSYSSKKLFSYERFVENNNTIVNESKIGEFLGWGAAKIAQLFGYGEDEAKQVKDEEVKTMKVSKDKAQKILSLYWTEIYTSRITKILLTEKEFEELTKELIQVKEEPGEGNGIIINGFDPIIEILKCFNRAYKLYTVPVIPGGRSSGAVDRATYAEYTSFGSGSSGGNLSAYNGPFRHNKTYNMWENAVLDIMKDREFQPIFDKDTQIQVGNKMKEGAGPILRKFMTDIMDGETLYKSKEDFGKGSGGAQKVLLEKYFGEVPDELKETAFGGAKEIIDNQKLQSDIKTAAVQFKESKSSSIDDPKKLKGMIFGLDIEMTKPADYKEEDKDKNKEIDAKKRYFYIQETDGDLFYVVFSRKFGNFAKYVANDYLNRDTKRTVSFNPSSLMTEAQTELYLTKIKFNDLRKMMTDGNKVKLMGQLHGTTNKINIGEQKTRNLEILFTSEDTGGAVPTSTEEFYNLEKLEFNGTKGFKTSELKSQSPQTL